MHKIDEFNEQGGETVEFAIALPILLVTAIAIIQLCLAGLQILALDAQVTKGSWDVTASELIASSDQAATVKTAILADGALLADDNLTVENCTVSTDSTEAVSGLPEHCMDETGMDDAGEFVHSKATAHVEADVSYNVASIVNIPGVTDMTITRHLSHTLVDTDRIEIR